MKQVSLDYTEGFSCLAGSCPDTCCKDWEIILDEDAISRYQKMPGVLGEQVRAAMLTDASLVEAVQALYREMMALSRQEQEKLLREANHA